MEADTNKKVSPKKERNELTNLEAVCLSVIFKFILLVQWEGWGRDKAMPCLFRGNNTEEYEYERNDAVGKEKRGNEEKIGKRKKGKRGMMLQLEKRKRREKRKRKGGK